MMPENPDQIILSNSYYPRGLTEGQSWSHYKYMKWNILNEINRRPTIIFFCPEENNIIVRRNLNNKPIILNMNNYDKIINGRTLSLSVVTDSEIDYFVLDIDAKNVDENSKKECVEKLINYIDKLSETTGYRVINSANSYHVHGLLNRYYPTDLIRKRLLEKIKNDFGNDYHVNKKGFSRGINIDFTPLYTGGSHTVPFALCRNGLVAKDITKTWKSYTRNKSILSEV